MCALVLHVQWYFCFWVSCVAFVILTWYCEKACLITRLHWQSSKIDFWAGYNWLHSFGVVVLHQDKKIHIYVMFDESTFVCIELFLINIGKMFCCNTFPFGHIKPNNLKTFKLSSVHFLYWLNTKQTCSTWDLIKSCRLSLQIWSTRNVYGNNIAEQVG